MYYIYVIIHKNTFQMKHFSLQVLEAAALPETDRPSHLRPSGGTWWARRWRLALRPPFLCQ